MLEEKLQEIVVVDTHTKEILAIISNDSIVQKDDIDVILNYTPNKKIIKDINGKIYLNDDEEV